MFSQNCARLLGKKLYQFHYMYSKYLLYKRKNSFIREIETFSL